MQQIRCEIGLDQQEATSTDRAGRRAVRGTTARKTSQPSRVAQLLEKLDSGDRPAEELMFANVYAEMRALAARHLRRERKSHTLQPTALVHEAYLKLAGPTRVDWQGRAHFLAVAAKAMREILVDHARRHKAAKRCGNRHRIALDVNLMVESSRDIDLLALEDALTKLAKLDPRQAKMIELRFFGGLSVAEVAKVMGISKRSVEREWTDGSRVVGARARQERHVMTAERYAQVRRLFLSACELAESEVGVFVDRACAGDPQLRDELESLLTQPRATTIIGTSSEDAALGKVLSPIAHLPRGLIPANILPAAAGAGNPRRFSPGETVAAERYKILAPLGGGGAGEVYKAHDQIMDQDVALKFLADREYPVPGRPAATRRAAVS